MSGYVSLVTSTPIWPHLSSSNSQTPEPLLQVSWQMVCSAGSSQEGEFGLAGQSSSWAKVEARRKKTIESSIVIIQRLRDNYQLLSTLQSPDPGKDCAVNEIKAFMQRSPKRLSQHKELHEKVLQRLQRQSTYLDVFAPKHRTQTSLQENAGFRRRECSISQILRPAFNSRKLFSTVRLSSPPPWSLVTFLI